MVKPLMIRSIYCSGSRKYFAIAIVPTVHYISRTNSLPQILYCRNRRPVVLRVLYFRNRRPVVSQVLYFRNTRPVVPQVLYFRTGTNSSQAIVGLELRLESGSALVSSSLGLLLHRTYKKLHI